MSNPQRMEQQNMEGLVKKAITALDQFFDNGDHVELDIAKAKVATSILGAAARMEQAKGARDSLTFQMARSLTTNPEQLERYIRVAMPSAPLVRALPEAKK
jgi:hypothetical protein